MGSIDIGISSVFIKESNTFKPLINGTLKDESGLPLRNAACRLHVVQRRTEAECKPSVLNATGHAYTVAGDPRTGIYSVDFQIVVRTDAHGRFEFISNVDGEATVFVEPASEHHVTHLALGRVSECLSDREFVVRADTQRRRIRVLDENGLPLSVRNIGFSDTTDPDVETMVLLALDDESRILGRRLTEGHSYFVSLRNERRRPIGRPRFNVVWDGGDEIRLTAPGAPSEDR